MKAQAKGAFEVKMTPHIWSESSPESQADPALGRFLLDKQYHGDLEAAGQGQMLSFGTGAKDSSGVYVAIEKISGTLGGRKGSFALYHTGVMNRGVPELAITIVPDSGTGELQGLAGTMTIQIVEGKHSYELEYTLATIQ